MIHFTGPQPDDDMPACPLVEELEKHAEEAVAAVQNQLPWIKEQTGIERCARADQVFGSLYETIVGPCPTGSSLAAYLTVGGRITMGFEDAKWDGVHKGAHYYNVALAELLSGNIDVASRYFLCADREDEIHKGTAPGHLFRDEIIYETLRRYLLNSWFEHTSLNYHDGLTSWEERRDRIIKAVCSMPGRYIVARCHAALLRACFVSGPIGWMPSPSELDRIRAVEDLGILSELVARKLDGRAETLGRLFREGPVKDEGFVSKRGISFLPCSASSAQSLETLRRARGGERAAMAAVVVSARNQAMHSSEFADWYLQPGTLEDVIRVQLDFISSLAAKHPAFAP